MATFALLVSIPIILVSSLYFIIRNLCPTEQNWIISHARYRSR
jgi:Sec-independent protein secretion pathway component TatC